MMGCQTLLISHYKKMLKNILNHMLNLPSAYISIGEFLNVELKKDECSLIDIAYCIPKRL